MPASDSPPSLELKNLIWVEFGLPRVTVQPTIEPSRGTPIGFLTVPTLTWKPVVRLTARHGLPGQLATVGGVVVPITPISASFAGAAAGIASASTAVAAVNVLRRLFISWHLTRPTAGCSGLTISLSPVQFLRGRRDRVGVPRRGDPRQAQRIVLVARDHVDVEVEHGLPRRGTAGVQQVDAVGAQMLARTPREALRAENRGLEVLRAD